MPEHGTPADPPQVAAHESDAGSLSRAMSLFDAYSDMHDENQAAALADLRMRDRPLHDALVRLLVADALDHALDVPPWQVHALQEGGPAPRPRPVAPAAAPASPDAT